jgi:hypothetical protein
MTNSAPDKSIKKTILLLNIFIGLGAISIAATLGSAFFLKSEEVKKRCSTILNTDVLKESLKLGTSFLINNQTSSGNFVYEYNWRKKKFTPQDSQVRQAGAAWGLALINQYEPNDKTKSALQKALRFMNDHSVTNKTGERFIAYPGEKRGKLGTVALVLLAHLDLISASNTTENEKKELKKFADQYIKFLTKARQDNGHWYGSYDIKTGEPSGASSPYFDGEALLALVKAAKYHGYERFEEDILKSAHSGYLNYIVGPRLRHKDPKSTKGYYQWSSMAFYEISQTEWKGSKKFAGYVIDLADWMIDAHRTLKRTRNTAYAYEGIIHAYALAKLKGDAFHTKKFACTIDQGLEKLTTWQVGHSISNKIIKSHPTADRHAIGGIQNHKHRPGLRIDVTQHQMHAVLLALRHYSDGLKL